MTTAIRLDDNLVRHASAEGQVHRRSTPKQIEYWAEIGRTVAGEVSAEDLTAILQGIRRVKVEPVVAEAVASDDLRAEVDLARESGELSRSIARGGQFTRQLETNRDTWKRFIPVVRVR
ncbi:MAG: TA system antitoxin ParD family protein [Marinobacter sp.]